MGLFSGVKLGWRKAEAAAIVEAAYEQVGRGRIDRKTAAKFANGIVESMANEIPDVWESKRGNTANKTSLALYSLLYFVETKADNDTSRAMNYLAIELILAEFARQVTDGTVWEYSELDTALLDNVVSEYLSFKDFDADHPLVSKLLDIKATFSLSVF
jgi:hypothetical protein